jgi:CheY-like chemotaxis protein
MPQTPRPLRVLVVDGSPDAADTLRVLLSLWGHQARVAPDATRALDEAPSFGPDVVIVDVGLPAPGGYEVAAGLSRQSPAARPLLLATASASQRVDQGRAAAAGFHVCLSKPYRPGLLAALLSAKARLLPPGA